MILFPISILIKHLTNQDSENEHREIIFWLSNDTMSILFEYIYHWLPITL